ncbi:MAG: FAD-dependent oxidoreductase [Bacteroidota bacterium]
MTGIPCDLHGALRETERCLQCHDAPCTAACPVHIDIPGFIRMLRSGNPRGAAHLIRAANPLAHICGEVCPQEVYCQASCTRGKQDAPVEIRPLHAFASTEERRGGYSTPRVPAPGGGRAAVIGGGPAGLACAFELRRLGRGVVLFEMRDPGGVPRSSIPSYRLSPEVLEGDLSFLLPHIEVRREEVGADSFRRIRTEYDAVFVAVGLGADRPLPLPGADLPGVIPVLRFLEDARSGAGVSRRWENVVVVGGGNVSLDAAATAKSLGASHVVLLYRRGESEMKIWKSELEEARARGVQVAALTQPMTVLGTGRVEGVRCLRTRLSGDTGPDGRRLPVAVEGSEHDYPADAVIAAIGQRPAAEFLQLLETKPEGYVETDGKSATSLGGVFAGGDVVGREGTIVRAVAEGRAAAQAMHAFMGKEG